MSGDIEEFLKSAEHKLRHKVDYSPDWQKTEALNVQYSIACSLLAIAQMMAEDRKTKTQNSDPNFDTRRYLVTDPPKNTEQPYKLYNEVYAILERHGEFIADATQELLSLIAEREQQAVKDYAEKVKRFARGADAKD